MSGDTLSRVVGAGHGLVSGMAADRRGGGDTAGTNEAADLPFEQLLLDLEPAVFDDGLTFLEWSTGVRAANLAEIAARRTGQS